MNASKVSMVIRPESTEDHDAIRQVVAAAFGSDAQAILVERIRASPEYEPEMALVATIGDAVVGYVMISGALIRNDDGERRISMLSPLAVVPSRQREGVGSALVRAAIAAADARGEPLVILEGNPAYYGRLGFEHSTRYGIEIRLPEWASPEAAQVMRLSSFDTGESSLQGVVVYPKAFEDLE